MKSFSQRQGIKPVRSILQVDEMDDGLRNGLWNVLDIYFWSILRKETYIFFDIYQKNNYQYSENPQFYCLCYLVSRLWVKYFKKRIDEFYPLVNVHFTSIKTYFLECQWFEVYEFIEFVAKNCLDNDLAKDFKELCNKALETELSAYRFIDDFISPIVSEIEINEIEEAISQEDRLKPVVEHLKRALELFSDRKSPDYRNSIKESISAVESLCILIVGRDKAKTLGEALNSIGRQGDLGLSSVLKQAFDKMYGYTNSEGGIRHALLDEPNLGTEEAKFMLVSCSAFINLLIPKADRAGINFSGGL
jgi:hypothetical protein